MLVSLVTLMFSGSSAAASFKISVRCGMGYSLPLTSCAYHVPTLSGIHSLSLVVDIIISICHVTGTVAVGTCSYDLNSIAACNHCTLIIYPQFCVNNWVQLLFSCVL